MSTIAVIIVILALVIGLAIGWWLGNRAVAAMRAERDARTDDFRKAITDLAGAEERARGADQLRVELAAIRDDRDAARTEIATLRADARAFEARIAEMKAVREAMTAEFSNVSNKLLTEAQRQFLERAEARFKQSEETSGQGLKALLQPVTERLQRYEEGVARVEKERRDAFGDLKGQIEQMRLGQEKVSTEAAKLVNSLRNAPKSRGRWGEQQLKNVLETCGLSEHTDFETEVSIAAEEGGRLRPDAIVRVPGGRSLVIDAKVSLNAYQDAFGEVDEQERAKRLDLHAASIRSHINGLAGKAYWSQFDDAPDYVIMFIPGEHFLSAALEHDNNLWNYAFEKRVLLATPTNLVAIARTVSAVWRQEKMAKQAVEIGKLGKEMHDRLAKVADDLRKVGNGLNSAVNNFNSFSNSFNGRLMVTGRKFLALNIESGQRELEDVSPVESLARESGGPPMIGERDEAAE